MKNTRKVAVQICGVKKKYRTGEIGGGTLQEELREWYHRVRARKVASAKEREPQSGEQVFYALKDIDLTIYQGETLGIIGKNGAGKSTLLKILSRITAPTEGTVDLYGRVASMLEVGTGFNGEMTGRENIYLNGAILGMTRAEIDEKMDDIIRFSEVEEFIDTPVKRYSSGMYVKLGFSVAAHLDSEIMIMDEVLAVGDMDFQHKCLDKMRSAAQTEGRTVLYVSHNMNTIKRLCDRCIVLDAGQIVFDGDVDSAIAIYLGVNDLMQTRFIYNEDFRPYDQYLRLNPRFNIDSLEIKNTERPVYAETEQPELQLKCTAVKPMERVGFRFELWYQDGTKVGTILSGNFVDVNQGENTICLELNLSHLAPGQYRADLVAYLFDDDGNEDILDGVYPGISFQVKQVLNRVHYLDWHHQYWGHIRLHDLRMWKVK